METYIVGSNPTSQGSLTESQPLAQGWQGVSQGEVHSLGRQRLGEDGLGGKGKVQAQNTWSGKGADMGKGP